MNGGFLRTFLWPYWGHLIFLSFIYLLVHVHPCLHMITYMDALHVFAGRKRHTFMRIHGCKHHRQAHQGLVYSLPSMPCNPGSPASPGQPAFRPSPHRRPPFLERSPPGAASLGESPEPRSGTLHAAPSAVGWVGDFELSADREGYVFMCYMWVLVHFYM